MTYLQLIEALRPYQKAYWKGGSMQNLQKLLDDYEYIYKYHRGKANIITKACKQNLVEIYNGKLEK